MQNLLSQAYDLLRQDERLLSSEGDLLKNKIQELAYKLDEKLIEMLLSDIVMKEKFFVYIKDVIVFDQKKFVQFINNKAFLPDSYTVFKNKIGLTDSRDQFVNESNDVVLDRPYKDCILAGGQDKEDNKRDEIFYNEVLGSDQIDRLLDPKVFTNFKKYTADGEVPLDQEEFGRFVRDENSLIKDNLIIKGNNLLALHSLKKQFAGKVKLIYIDPPYNTGNDGFKYNDKFNHSTWLTFMKNRLEVAKELLSDDGSIYVNIDNNESHYLKILMDNVFGKNNFQREIIRRIGWLSGYKTIEKNFIRNHDTIFFYSKNNNNVLFNKQYIDNKDFKELVKYEKIKEKLLELNLTKTQQNDLLDFINHKSRPDRYPIEDTWNSNEYDDLNSIAIVSFSGESVSKMLGGEDLKGQKSEKLIKRIIESSTNPGDIVLDYHLGSGTTCAVAHKMGRQYIGVEQMDYIETIAVERMKKVIEGEQGGISKSVDRQGGGEFVYMEIAQNNQKLTQAIHNAEDSQELISLYHQLKESSFINYAIDIKTIDANISAFEHLSSEDMKRFLTELIDKNALYINYSEINDTSYSISEADKALNKQFYQ